MKYSSSGFYERDTESGELLFYRHRFRWERFVIQIVQEGEVKQRGSYQLCLVAASAVALNLLLGRFENGLEQKIPRQGVVLRSV